jgi:hypothetical protein
MPMNPGEKEAFPWPPVSAANGESTAASLHDRGLHRSQCWSVALPAMIDALPGEFI